LLLTPTKTEQRTGLGPYWRSVGICAVILPGYIAVITALHTETATRSTAPPWFAWVRYPLARDRWQCAFLILPVIVFASWVATVRRTRTAPLFWAFLAILLINVTVAMMDGSPAAIWKPFNRPGSEYFSDVPAVQGIGSFLHGYVENRERYSIHTRTHPPGAVLFLYFVARLLRPGIAPAAWSAVVVTATGIVPFYLLARRLAGERIARLAVALYPIAPSLVLFGATSMDGVFLVPLLWSVYFLQRVVSQGGLIHAIAAGLSLTISLMFSYVTVCIGVMMLIYAILELAENPKPLGRIAGSFAICAFLIVGLLAIIYHLTGFNYLACLQASRFYDHYSMQTFSVSVGRYIDISFGNLIAFLIGVGLPVLVLWGRESIESLKLRTSADRFNIALVISVLFFSFARLFTHETERVWLFFIPPALITAASWIERRGDEEGRLLEWTMCLSFAQTWLFQLLLFTIW
jgi:dolichyl-phosphate-mannose-protein mannosyltransferase